MSPYFRFNKKGRALISAGRAEAKLRVAPEYGTWWLRVKNAGNERERVRSKARLKEEAERMERDLNLQAERQRAGLEVASVKAEPCCDMFDAYLAAHAHLGSQAPMRSQVKVWFKPHFGRTPTVAVAPADCQALLEKSRRAGQAANTVRQLYVRGSLMFEWARAVRGTVRTNPWDAVVRPAPSKKSVLYLSREQVRAMVDAAGDELLLLLVLVLAGLRRGEVGGLKWAHVMWDAQPLPLFHVQASWGRDRTKGGKDRFVPIHPALLPVLRAGWEARTDAFVFPAPRRGGMRHDSWHLSSTVRRIATRAGVTLPPRFTAHGMRKTFLTHLTQDTGGDIVAAQRLAGHSSPVITEAYYLGRNTEHLARAMSALQLVPAPDHGHGADTRAASSSPATRTTRRKGQ